MAENSKIEWTTKKYPDGRIIPGHTHNEWIGCHHVSPGCERCYAESLDKRYQYGGQTNWGSTAPRYLTSEHNRNNPYRWNRKAKAQGTRPFVFCSSLSDILEDHPLVNKWRPSLLDKIVQCDQLDWLLLTKRPENAARFLAQWFDAWPQHIWFGCTCENQTYADKRREAMAAVPALHKFVSYEPAIGQVDWSGWQDIIDWLIVGGESGHEARPMHPDWPIAARDWAVSNEIAFHFKQWGKYYPTEQHSPTGGGQVVYVAGNGRCVTDTPFANITNGAMLWKAKSKQQAGRSLDGRTWNEFPES